MRHMGYMQKKLAKVDMKRRDADARPSDARPMKLTLPAFLTADG